MHLYDYLDSGNGYKVRLLLAQLRQPYGWTSVDIDKGETRTADFLARNPNGRIPTLRLDDGSYLAESNAILWYLAEGSRFVPTTRLGRAQVLQWMFFEQYSHEPYVATPRYICRHLPADHPRRAELPGRIEKGHAALKVMEGHLATRDFFVEDRYGIADIALYAYTHVTPDGGLELGAYPRVREWLARVEAQQDHVKLLDVPVAPRTPCYAVIFTSQRTDGDDGYEAMAARMVELAAKQPGFVGVESARDASGFGITVSYWTSLEAIAAWRAHEEHRVAQHKGRTQWYAHFETRVARID